MAPIVLTRILTDNFNFVKFLNRKIITIFRLHWSTQFHADKSKNCQHWDRFQFLSQSGFPLLTFKITKWNIYVIVTVMCAQVIQGIKMFNQPITNKEKSIKLNLSWLINVLGMRVWTRYGRILRRGACPLTLGRDRKGSVREQKTIKTDDVLVCHFSYVKPLPSLASSMIPRFPSSDIETIDIGNYRKKLKRERVVKSVSVQSFTINFH